MTHEEKVAIVCQLDAFCAERDGCENCILEDMCEKHEWGVWDDGDNPPTIPDYDWRVLHHLMDAYSAPKGAPAKATEATPDPVNHPNHYCVDGYECFDVMIALYGKEVVQHFCLCNAFKYLWRHGRKNGDEDLAKAKVYLDKYKELGGNA